MPTVKPIKVYVEPRVHEDCDWPTPVRAGIQYIVSFIEVKGLDFTCEDVYDFCGIPSSSSADIVANGKPRRGTYILNEISGNAKRSPKHALSDKQIQAIEDQIEYGGIHIRALNWLALAKKCGITGLSYNIIFRAMNTRGYEKFVTCQKTWLKYGTRLARESFADFSSAYKTKT